MILQEDTLYLSFDFMLSGISETTNREQKSGRPGRAVNCPRLLFAAQLTRGRVAQWLRIQARGQTALGGGGETWLHSLLLCD